MIDKSIVTVHYSPLESYKISILRSFRDGLLEIGKFYELTVL